MTRPWRGLAWPWRVIESPVMSAPDPRQLPGVSVKQAAIRYGTSESDIRRRIKRGELAAESIPRAGGTLLRVLLDPLQAAPAPPPHSEPPPAPAALSDAPAATTRLLDKLDERDATIGRLHGELLAATERAARSEALAEAREQALEFTQAQLDVARAELDQARSRRWWRFW